MLPTASVTRLANGLHELKIQGIFSHPHWIAFLLSGLSEKRVSVLEGRGAQHNHQWNAALCVDFRSSMTLPEHMNYVEMAQRRPVEAPLIPPRLSAFELSRRIDGGLEVQVYGPDELGFLGRLLSEVSLLALFPVHLQINTVGGQIEDRLVFRGIGGSTPSEATEQALEMLLRSFIIR